jgi:phospholipid/cholesterol/gamma-HCH transport system substrate-binding protein
MSRHPVIRLRVLIRALAALVIATLTLTGCGFHGLYGTHLPGGADVGSHPYSVTIYFADVLDLVPQSAVKVNDVAVGRVEDVTLSSKNDNSGDPKTNGWTAKVTVTVNSDVQLPANARAMIKQTSLLGEKYVDLEQPLGQPAATELKSGDTIPITRTGSAPEVEEVLGALSLLLNGGGLQQIRVITTELNKALNGHEAQIRDLVGQLNTFIGTLDQQKQQILTALDSVNRLAVTLNDNKQKIVEALDTFPKALQILKDDTPKLTTMLTSLSRLGSVATDVIDKTQSQFVTALKALSPAVEQLTAAGSNLVNALKIAGTFPFPLGNTLQFVHGDYANLHMFVDLNLSDELCSLNKALCKATSKLPSERDTSNGSNSTKTNSSSTQPLSTQSSLTQQLAHMNPASEPMLIGVSG